MRPNQSGFTLVETMLAVLVTSICLLGLLKLLSTSNRTLVQSMGSLQAQASAEDLMQRIRLMRWDEGSVPGLQMNLAGPPIPKVVSPPVADRTALEHWSDYADVDASRGIYGTFNRNVRVEFVQFSGNKLITSTTPSHRKKVTVWAVGRTSSATITSVFYNIP